MTAHRSGDPGAPPAWHLIPLAVLAISHPIAAVLVHGPEFLVAHRFDRSALLWLAFGLFVALPGGFWLVAATVYRCSATAGRWVTLLLFVGLAALMAGLALKQAGVWDTRIVLLGGLALACVAGSLYARVRSCRLFVSLLAPAPVVALVVFLASAPAISLMRGPQAVQASQTTVESRTPVVMVVFDQLPLVSLLDVHGGIDRVRYPHFAALAADATWYRNTTAVSGSTTWALPALLTGRYPAPDQLPSFLDHPDNLFSLLGRSHRLQVVEPMTALCPIDLCEAPDDAPGMLARWPTVLADLAIVYGHILLPDGLVARLPPVTHEWGGFGRDFWQVRWIAQRDDDRQRSFLDWMARIDGTSQPALHFLHVLLPHEPYVYLASGQRGAANDAIHGLDADEVWLGDPYLTALNYQRHLIQLQYVDTLLGRLVERLKVVGLYDRAVIAVVADHGASFQPEHMFKAPSEATLAGVGAIPFLVKQPDRPGGQVVDTPLEAVDVLPTIIHALNAEVPWDIDGHAAQIPGIPKMVRRIYAHPSDPYFTFTADAFADLVRAAVQEKFDRVGADADRFDRPGDPARHLIGVPLATLTVTGAPVFSVAIDGAAIFDAVDPAGAFVPVYVSGTVQPLVEGAEAPAHLAVAVNGVIRATASVADRAVSGREGFWAVLLPPAAYRPGHNDITVWHIVPDSPGPAVRPTLPADLPGQPPNLVDPVIQAALTVTTDGFYGIEHNGHGIFQWTRGRATLSLPIDPQNPPRALHVSLLAAAHPARRLELRANECVLFRDHVPEWPWRATLPLSDCQALGDSLTITFIADTFAPGGEEPRTLGIAVESVQLASTPPG